MTDNDSGVLVLALLALIPVIGLVVITILPGWYAIQGVWVEYLNWVWWSLSLGRWILWLYIILIIINCFMGGNIGNIILIPSIIILSVWGYPLLYEAIKLLVTTELTGLELQRTILQILIIEVWSHSTAQAIDFKKEKK